MKNPTSKPYTVTVSIPIKVVAVNKEHAASVAHAFLSCLDGWVFCGRDSKPDLDSLDYVVALETDMEPPLATQDRAS